MTIQEKLDVALEALRSICAENADVASTTAREALVSLGVLDPFCQLTQFDREEEMRDG